MHIQQDKNSGPQGGADIHQACLTTDFPVASANAQTAPNAKSKPVESKIKTPPSNTFNKYYYFD
jgi:hypothetical protein